MMTKKDDVTSVDSIEEYTVYTLDRSLEGLEDLRRDSIRCGEKMTASPFSAIEEFRGLCQNLRNFFVFEADIRNLFMLDTEQLRDRSGSLKTVEDDFERLLQEFPQLMFTNDFPGLAERLRVTLPGVIDRFQDLIPALKNHIEDEYINPDK